MQNNSISCGRRRLVLTSLAMGVAVLSGCAPGSDETSGASRTEGSSMRFGPPREGYYGFDRKIAGELMAGVRVVVLFDPLCPHCLSFWETLRDVPVAQYWVPLGLMGNGKSTPYSAEILSSADPSARFEELKPQLARGVWPQVSPPGAARSAIDKNSEKFRADGLRSFPSFAIITPGRLPKYHAGGVTREAFLAQLAATAPTI